MFHIRIILHVKEDILILYNSFKIFNAKDEDIPLIFVSSFTLLDFIFSMFLKVFNNRDFKILPIPSILSKEDAFMNLALLDLLAFYCKSVSFVSYFLQ